MPASGKKVICGRYGCLEYLIQLYMQLKASPKLLGLGTWVSGLGRSFLILIDLGLLIILFSSVLHWILRQMQKDRSRRSSSLESDPGVDHWWHHPLPQQCLSPHRFSFLSQPSWSQCTECINIFDASSPFPRDSIFSGQWAGAIGARCRGGQGSRYRGHTP